MPRFCGPGHPPWRASNPREAEPSASIRASVHDGIELPLAGQALQRVAPAVFEREARPGHEVLDGARHQHLARSGAARRRARRCAPRCRRTCRPSARTRRCAAPARTSMPSGLTALADRRSAQRTARAGPSKVARKPSPAVSISRPRKRASSRRTDRVVALEQLAPASVAQRAAAVSVDADDVGEEHGGEHALGLGMPAHAGQELLDLVEDRLGVVEVRQVVCSGQLDQLRARESSGPCSGCLRRAS